jgi:hypothetical protein
MRKPLDFRRQDDGLLFPVIEAAAIVFAVALFFADFPKQPTGPDGGNDSST